MLAKYEEIRTVLNMVNVRFNEETKIWTSSDVDATSAVDPSKPLGHILLESMKYYGSKIAQVKF